MFYDPMIAKLCSWGQTREISIKRMESALDNFLLEGIDHNIPFLSAILANKRFKSGDLSTSFIQEEYKDGFNGVSPSVEEEWSLASLIIAYHVTETIKDNENFKEISDEWEVHLKYNSMISDDSILRFKTEQLDNEQNQIKVKPLPNKNVPGIVDDFIPISLEKDFSKKLVSADIELFDTAKSEITYPKNSMQNKL